MGLSEHLIRGRREPIPWRRLAGLMRPARRSLAGMVALTALGSLVGLVPPLALGSLVDGLAGGRHRGSAGLDAALIVVAIVLEALAFAVSDGFFARAVGTLYRDLRTLMFAGVRRRAPDSAQELAGVAARFVSDAEALQELVVSPLDVSVMGLFELLTALVALALLYPPAALVAAVLIALAVLVTRVTQAPVAQAAVRRQEALEAMSASLAAELSERLDRAAAARRFHEAATRVLRREVRVGWLEAANRYGSGAAANLGPIAVVVLAAFSGSFSAGTLIALFLLAGRAFQGADALIDLSLDVELVRGAVARCFELVDAGAPTQDNEFAQAARPLGGERALAALTPGVAATARAEGLEPPRA
jgi:ABC-type multidrug transport system fused ATPase/permease subunit